MTDIALAASARDWPDRLHRHVLDHGGARVVGRLMGPTQVIDTDFDVVFIDDVCSFLTPGLVGAIRSSGREVIGVFSPDDGPDGKRRLLECGISDVIECDAAPHEYLEKATFASAVTPEPPPSTTSRSSSTLALGVVGVVDGVGATEVAIALGSGVAQDQAAVLVDLDPVWPSVGQRLDLAPHPNLRSLVDAAVHDGGAVASNVQRLEGLGVVVGSPTTSQIPVHELRLAFDAAASGVDVIIADLGSLDRAQQLLMRAMDSVVLVGSADPVGVSRALRASARLHENLEGTSVLLVVNKTPRRRFHRVELKDELERLGGVPVALLPFDPRIGSAAWEGVLTKKGPFAREIRQISSLIGEVAR